MLHYLVLRKKYRETKALWSFEKAYGPCLFILRKKYWQRFHDLVLRKKYRETKALRSFASKEVPIDHQNRHWVDIQWRSWEEQCAVEHEDLKTIARPSHDDKAAKKRSDTTAKKSKSFFTKKKSNRFTRLATWRCQMVACFSFHTTEESRKDETGLVLLFHVW